MIISPGVALGRDWEKAFHFFFFPFKENCAGENALRHTHSVLLPPGRAGVEGELNLEPVFQVLELING